MSKENPNEFKIINKNERLKYRQIINQLKQQLDESFTEEDVNGLIEDRDKTIKFMQKELAEKDCRIEELEGQFAYECECNKQLVDLQKQLEEKQKTIDEINKEFVQAVHDWKTLCAEKDKEIERLKVFEKAYYFNQTQVSQESMDLLLQNAYQVHNETQLAIQELEKAKDLIKHFCEIHSDEFYGVKAQVKGIEQNVCESIDNQIKILKGE